MTTMVIDMTSELMPMVWGLQATLIMSAAAIAASGALPWINRLATTLRGSRGIGTPATAARLA